LSQSSGRSDNNNYILRLKEKLYKAHEKGLAIELIWIPSHTGITGNEIADTLASSAISQGKLVSHKLEYFDFYQVAKDHSKSRFQKIIDRNKHVKGKFYFTNYYNENSNKPWFSSFNQLNRRVISTVNRIRSNHINSNESLFCFHIINSPKCPCGHQYQDLNHLLWLCPLYIPQRINWIKRLNNIQINSPFSTKSVFNNPSPSFLKSFNIFLNEAKLTI